MSWQFVVLGCVYLICLALMAIFGTGCATEPAFSTTPAGITAGSPPEAATEITVKPDGSQSLTITPETQAEKANAVWVRYGATAGAVGLILLGMQHFRTGAIVIAGAAGMAWLGNRFADATLDVPVWVLPSVLLLGAAFMLYGYFTKQNQTQQTLVRSETLRATQIL